MSATVWQDAPDGAELARIARLRDVVRDLEAAIAQGHAIDIASNLTPPAYKALMDAMTCASIRF